MAQWFRELLFLQKTQVPLSFLMLGESQPLVTPDLGNPRPLKCFLDRLLVGSECFSVKREMNVFERNIVGREWDGVHSAASAVGGITINMLCGREVVFFYLF